MEISIFSITCCYRLIYSSCINMFFYQVYSALLCDLWKASSRAYPPSSGSQSTIKIGAGWVCGRICSRWFNRFINVVGFFIFHGKVCWQPMKVNVCLNNRSRAAELTQPHYVEVYQWTYKKEVMRKWTRVSKKLSMGTTLMWNWWPILFCAMLWATGRAVHVWHMVGGLYKMTLFYLVLECRGLRPNSFGWHGLMALGLLNRKDGTTKSNGNITPCWPSWKDSGFIKYNYKATQRKEGKKSELSWHGYWIHEKKVF